MYSGAETGRGPSNGNWQRISAKPGNDGARLCPIRSEMTVMTNLGAINFLVARPGLTAMLTSACGSLFMVIAAVLVLVFFSSEGQGYFFTFLSFGAFMQLADFGLTYAGMQTASHLAASDTQDALARLRHKILRLSLWATLLAVIVAGYFGTTTMLKGDALTSSPVSWQAPWVAFLLSAALNQPLSVRLAVREGCGHIGEIWLIRLIQEGVAGLILVAVLAFDGGLWALPAAMFGRVVPGTILLLIREGDAIPPVPDHGLVWRRDVWPFQWRIGLSYVCGFLLFRAVPPILLAQQGPVLAGQFGLAFSMMNMAISLTIAWPSSQAARYGRLVADGNYEELVRQFRPVFWRSTLLAVFVFILGNLAIHLFVATFPRFSPRFPEPMVTALVLAAAMAHHVSITTTIPLRAERHDPFLPATLFGSALTISAIVLAAYFGNAFHIAIAHLASVCIGLPIAWFIYRGRHKIWFSPSSQQ